MFSSSSISGKVINNLGKSSLVTFTRSSSQIVSKHAIPSIKTAPSVIQHSVEESTKRKMLLERPGMFGIKRGMITWYTEDGKQHAATVVEIDSCEVMGHKNKEDHGYDSVIVGAIDKLKNVKGVDKFTAAGISPKHKFGEFKIRGTDPTGFIPVGTELRADYFAVGQMIDVIGVTKGKGFAGVMKRHGFGGLCASHGVSRAHRSAGGMGGNQNPGRVFPGKKMAGRMGGRNSTSFNKEVLHVDGDAGIIILKGNIPGPNKSVVRLRDAVKLYGRCLNGVEKQ